jgi:hypothetical protein
MCIPRLRFFSVSVLERQPLLAMCCIGALVAAAASATSATADPFRWTLIEDDTSEERAPDPARFAAADTANFEVIGTYANDFQDTSLGLVDAGASWFVADGVSFGLFGEALYASQDPDDAWGGGGGALLRWHFLQRERFTIFAEAGCGLLATDGRLPSEGTEINFTPRVSVGATVELNATTQLLARVGWLHVSNAQTGDENSGIDALAVGLGLSFAF